MVGVYAPHGGYQVDERSEFLTYLVELFLAVVGFKCEIDTILARTLSGDQNLLAVLIIILTADAIVICFLSFATNSFRCGA